MIPPFLVPILAQGLNLVGNAVLAKGKEWVKEKSGVDLDKASLSESDYSNLRQFEMEHEEELLRIRQADNQLEAAVEMAYLKDTQSAREMQVAALQQQDLFSKHFIYGFAIFWSLAAIGYVFTITLASVPKDNVRFADTVLGFLLGTVIAQVINFFYGSSKSSQAKDETIKQAVVKVMENPK